MVLNTGIVFKWSIKDSTIQKQTEWRCKVDTMWRGGGGGGWQSQLKDNNVSSISSKLNLENIAHLYKTFIHNFMKEKIVYNVQYFKWKQ